MVRNIVPCAETLYPIRRGSDDIRHEEPDDAADECVLPQPRSLITIGGADVVDHPPSDRQLFRLRQIRQVGTQTVFEVVGLLRDLVCHRHSLSFEMTWLVEVQTIAVGQRKRVLHLP